MWRKYITPQVCLVVTRLISKAWVLRSHSIGAAEASPTEWFFHLQRKKKWDFFFCQFPPSSYKFPLTPPPPPLFLEVHWLSGAKFQRVQRVAVRGGSCFPLAWLYLCYLSFKPNIFCWCEYFSSNRDRIGLVQVSADRRISVHRAQILTSLLPKVPHEMQVLGGRGTSEEQHLGMFWDGSVLYPWFFLILEIWRICSDWIKSSHCHIDRYWSLLLVAMNTRKYCYYM